MIEEEILVKYGKRKHLKTGEKSSYKQEKKLLKNMGGKSS
jgi:hypothetical protein